MASQTNTIIDEVACTLKAFDIDPQYGFASPNCIPTLSSTHPCHEWEMYARRISHLLATNIAALRPEIDSMPLLDASHLTTKAQQQRAFFVLNFILHGYLNLAGTGKPGIGEQVVVPKCLSIPLHNLSKIRDTPIGQTHDLLILTNWAKQPASPSSDARDGESIQTTLHFCDAIANDGMLPPFANGGLVSEAWFYLGTVEVEANGGACIQPLCTAVKIARVSSGNVHRDRAAVTEATKQLQLAQAALLQANESMRKMFHHIVPDDFFGRVRLNLGGWKGWGDDAVVFEGLSQDQLPPPFPGGSSAQSALLPAVDALLGIQHNDPYLRSIRPYLRKEHREFVNAVETEYGGVLRTWIADLYEKNPRDSSVIALVATYNSCLEDVAKFREIHLSFVRKFIVPFLGSGGVGTGGVGTGGVGTGGTGLEAFLEPLKRNVQRALFEVTAVRSIKKTVAATLASVIPCSMLPSRIRNLNLAWVAATSALVAFAAWWWLWQGNSQSTSA